MRHPLLSEIHQALKYQSLHLVQAKQGGACLIPHWLRLKL